MAASRSYLTASLAGDFVGVVDFDSSARVVGPFQELPAAKTALIAAIDLIDASGGTNIGAGVFMDHGPQIVMVHDAGRLELFGSDPGPVAVKLVDTAATGATEIHLPSGTGWSEPAQIVVAPSGFEHAQAEERTMELAAVGAFETWDFAGPLAHIGIRWDDSCDGVFGSWAYSNDFPGFPE